MTIIDAEAQVIRECAHRVLAGESVRAVAADLNTRGPTTAAGKPWNVTALKGVLISARISGRREYTAKDTYDNNTRPALGEITATGTWPAIITPKQSDRLRALLTTPARGGAHTARRYLLSAVFHCGLCGHPMYGRNHNGKPRYQCIKDPGKPGCGKVAVYAHLANGHRPRQDPHRPASIPRPAADVDPPPPSRHEHRRQRRPAPGTSKHPTVLRRAGSEDCRT